MQCDAASYKCIGTWCSPAAVSVYIQNGSKDLWWHLQARLRKMKEVKNVDDVDLPLSDMSHHEKTILADLERLRNVTADKEWRENAAKVCSAVCTLVQSAEFLTQLHLCM